MDKVQRTLIVRHLPEELGEDDQIDLLKNFGASHVRSMGHKGRLKHMAFATFSDEETAGVALKRLHQLEVLGHKLIVEVSKKQHGKFFPDELNEIATSDVKEEPMDAEVVQREKKKEAEKQKLQLAQEINQMSEKFGMDYPLNPKLQYIYPPPTVATLTNVANALASVPKFYTQVLHLMNKMNLPPPFGAVTTTPPLASEPKPARAEREQSKILEPDVMETTEMDLSSEEESELESEEEDSEVSRKDGSTASVAATKRTKRHGLEMPRKRAKLQLAQLPMAKSKTSVQKVEEVFEVPHASGSKKAEFKLTPAMGIPTALNQSQGLAQIQDNIAPYSAHSLPDKGTAGWNIQTNADLLSITEAPPSGEEGGFGKLEPVVKPAEEQTEEEGEEEEWGATEFISSRKLRRNQISRSEMRDISAFRKYQEGEPTSRLYVKNISRQVTDKDLHYVFGKYVDWEDEAQKLVFDIRLMKEGKMKGQAFITLPDEKRAMDALRDTHGFMMKGKPIVVQFARSAKPKEKDEKDKKSKSEKS